MYQGVDSTALERVEKMEDTMQGFPFELYGYLCTHMELTCDRITSVSQGMLVPGKTTSTLELSNAQKGKLAAAAVVVLLLLASLSARFMGRQ